MSAARVAARRAMHFPAAVLAVLVYALVVAPWSRVVAQRRRRSGERPRILWGPVAIANLRSHALADRTAGYESETLVYRLQRETDRGEFDHVLDRFTRVRYLGQLVPYAAFVWAGFRFDLFGFYFDGGLVGETPFWRIELPLLRLAGKRVVVVPYGGDARLASHTRSLGKWHAYTDVPPDEEDRDEEDVRARVDAFGRWASAVLGCADLVDALPRVDGVFLYPFDVDRWLAGIPPRTSRDGRVRIVHASNHRHYKGTRYLIEAVETLAADGVDLELVLVERMSSEEARRAYVDADVIADQFLIGAYALFAIEAMALGKPVVCYLNPRFAPWHPEWEECPIVSATPDSLADELRRLVLDPELRAELGARGPEYVRRYHSLGAVGKRMDAIYRSLWRF